MEALISIIRVKRHSWRSLVHRVPSGGRLMLVLLSMTRIGLIMFTLAVVANIAACCDKTFNLWQTHPAPPIGWLQPELTGYA